MIDLLKITSKDKKKYSDRAWVKLINSLSGVKSANIIGTISNTGKTNATMISSAFHLGATPPLIGFVLRPEGDSTPRHSFLNIQETGHFTINHITKDFYKNAHQTSARYPKEISEFEECKLPLEENSFPAPYLKSSNIKIGLKFINSYEIKENNTRIIIGEIIEFYAPKDSFYEDGHIDIEASGSLAVTGLDSYHEIKKLSRLNYAKTNVEVHEINVEKTRPIK